MLGWWRRSEDPKLVGQGRRLGRVKGRLRFEIRQVVEISCREVLPEGRGRWIRCGELFVEEVYWCLRHDGSLEFDIGRLHQPTRIDIEREKVDSAEAQREVWKSQGVGMMHTAHIQLRPKLRQWQSPASRTLMYLEWQA